MIYKGPNNKMICQQVQIQNKYGLHTRAAVKLVDMAQRFQSKIELVRDKHNIDCKSIMSVITSGAQKGDTFELKVQGQDETNALKAVKQLIDNRFDESE